MNTPMFDQIRRRVRLARPTTGSALRWLQRAGVLVLVLFAVVAVLGRVIGVPLSWKDRLVAELATRGLIVDVKKLTVDPLGGLVARDLVVYRDESRKVEQLRVGRVELNLNWLAWQNGEPILSGARLRGAEVAWPLGEGVEAEARRVEAQIEFRPGEVRIQRLRGQVLGFDLDLQGRVGLKGGQILSPHTLPLASLWRNLQKGLEDFGGPAPKIQAEFSVEIGQPEASEAEILLTAQQNVWRGVRIPQVEFRATVAEGGARLDKCRIVLGRGQIDVVGWADFTKGLGEVEYTSDVDPSLLAPAAGGLKAGLQELKCQHPSQITGKVEGGWKEKSYFLWQGRLQMKDFRLGATAYRELCFPWVTDGKRVMLQGLKLESVRGGSFEGQVNFDGVAELKGEMKSTLDPKGLAPFFGPAAAPFWRSINFAVEPKVEAKISGAGLSLDLMRFEGRIDAGAFQYKDVAIDRLAGDFVFAGKELKVTQLQLATGGGEASGELRYGTAPLAIFFTGVKSTLPVKMVAPMFGPKFVKMMAPYDFQDCPTVTLEGKVDLEGEGGSNLLATAKSSEGMNYLVAGKPLRFRDLDTTVEVIGRKTIVKTAKGKMASLLGGKVEVQVEVDGAKAIQRTDVKMQRLDFGPVVEIYFGNQGYAGELGGTFHLEGSSKDWRQWSGYGRWKVEDGVLPGMGPFEKAMNAPADWVGASGQDAEMDFNLEKGKLDVNRLEITSTLVVTIGKGVYDIANDQLEDFILRQNIRGPVGVPFFLVSEMFQVEGSGSLKNPIWKPRHFQDK